MPELKPCECGGSAKWECEEGRLRVICDRCWVTTEWVRYFRFIETSEQAKSHAIELWNRRQGKCTRYTKT